MADPKRNILSSDIHKLVNNSSKEKGFAKEFMLFIRTDANETAESFNITDKAKDNESVNIADKAKDNESVNIADKAKDNESVNIANKAKDNDKEKHEKHANKAINNEYFEFQFMCGVCDNGFDSVEELDIHIDCHNDTSYVLSAREGLRKCGEIDGKRTLPNTMTEQNASNKKLTKVLMDSCSCNTGSEVEKQAEVNSLRCGVKKEVAVEDNTSGGINDAENENLCDAECDNEKFLCECCALIVDRKSELDGHLTCHEKEEGNRVLEEAVVQRVSAENHYLKHSLELGRSNSGRTRSDWHLQLAETTENTTTGTDDYVDNETFADTPSTLFNKLHVVKKRGRKRKETTVPRKTSETKDAARKYITRQKAAPRRRKEKFAISEDCVRKSSHNLRRTCYKRQQQMDGKVEGLVLKSIVSGSKAKNSLMNPSKGKQKRVLSPRTKEDEQLLRQFGIIQSKVCLQKVAQATAYVVTEAESTSCPGNSFKSVKTDNMAETSRYKTRNFSQDCKDTLNTSKGPVDSCNEASFSDSDLDCQIIEQPIELIVLDDDEEEAKVGTEEKDDTKSDAALLKAFGIKDVSINLTKDGLIDKQLSKNNYDDVQKVPFIASSPNKGFSGRKSVLLRKKRAQTKILNSKKNPVKNIENLPAGEIDKLLQQYGMGISIPLSSSGLAGQSYNEKTRNRSPSPVPSTSDGYRRVRRKRTARKSCVDSDLMQKFKLKESSVLLQCLSKIEISMLRNPHSLFGKTNWLSQKFDTDSESDIEWDIPSPPLTEDFIEDDRSALFTSTQRNFKNVDKLKRDNDKMLLEKFGLSEPIVLLDRTVKEVNVPHKTFNKTEAMSDESLIKKFGLKDVQIVVDRSEEKKGVFTKATRNRRLRITPVEKPKGLISDDELRKRHGVSDLKIVVENSATFRPHRFSLEELKQGIDIAKSNLFMHSDNKTVQSPDSKADSASENNRIRRSKRTMMNRMVKVQNNELLAVKEDKRMIKGKNILRSKTGNQHRFQVKRLVGRKSKNTTKNKKKPNVQNKSLAPCRNIRIRMPTAQKLVPKTSKARSLQVKSEMEMKQDKVPPSESERKIDKTQAKRKLDTSDCSPNGKQIKLSSEMNNGDLANHSLNLLGIDSLDSISYQEKSSELDETAKDNHEANEESHRPPDNDERLEAKDDHELETFVGNHFPASETALNLEKVKDCGNNLQMDSPDLPKEVGNALNECEILSMDFKIEINSDSESENSLEFVADLIPEHVETEEKSENSNRVSLNDVSDKERSIFSDDSSKYSNLDHKVSTLDQDMINDKGDDIEERNDEKIALCQDSHLVMETDIALSDEKITIDREANVKSVVQHLGDNDTVLEETNKNMKEAGDAAVEKIQTEV